MINLKSFNLLDLTSQVSRIHVVQSFDLKYGQVMTSLQMLWMMNTIKYWTCDLCKAGLRQSISHFPMQDPRDHDLKRKISAGKSPERGLKMAPFNVTSLCRGAISLFFVGFMRKKTTHKPCLLRWPPCFWRTSSPGLPRCSKLSWKFWVQKTADVEKYVEWWTISLGTRSMHILTFHQAAISACHNEIVYT